jgi:hypothetical protein
MQDHTLGVGEELVIEGHICLTPRLVRLVSANQPPFDSAWSRRGRSKTCLTEVPVERLRFRYPSGQTPIARSHRGATYVSNPRAKKHQKQGWELK